MGDLGSSKDRRRGRGREGHHRRGTDGEGSSGKLGNSLEQSLGMEASPTRKRAVELGGERDGIGRQRGRRTVGGGWHRRTPQRGRRWRQHYGIELVVLDGLSVGAALVNGGQTRLQLRDQNEDSHGDARTEEH
jgi:hypothetical protein